MLTEPLILWFDEAGLSLRQAGRKAMGPVRCDFVGGAVRHRRLYGGGKSQTIAKAVGMKGKARPFIADLTAGLGTDASTLAALGCRVVMVERNPIVALLLEDGLARLAAAAKESDELARLSANLSLVTMPAAEWLSCLAADACPDVIYLDPMFPQRRNSAEVNKNMQIFHQVVGCDDDADSLLPLALSKARHRVVVKRPARAPWLAGHEPGLSFAGKSVRFDVYALKKIA